MDTYIKKILEANVYDVAEQTPLDSMPRLAARIGNNIRLKREDLQPVFSFKVRGAYNKMVSLSPEQAQRGVICASAGNHAQGVALAAEKLAIRAVVVMPGTTPPIKIQAVRNYGAEVILTGDTFNVAFDHARQLEREQGLTFVHPFDDPDVIAGQGTVGMEILRQHAAPLAAIFVGVGGGGLLAGVASWVKFLRPEIKVIGVEPHDAACMQKALESGGLVKLNHIGIFADGAAVAQAGEHTFAIAQRSVDEVITVDTDQICAAIKDIFDDTRAIAEPAGALALAGLKHYVAREGIRGANLVAVLTGANINFDRLRHVAERAEIGEQREALLAVTIPERPGSFLRFCDILGKRSITEFNYRFADRKDAHIFVGVELREGRDEKDRICELLATADYPVLDLTDDEMAKLHVRYMVGGRSSGLDDEVLYRFEFPERPGALLQFLSGIGPWNISLFHYRNHGSAYGRVLVGIQVPVDQRPALEAYFHELGYPFVREDNNPAYRLFLDGNGNGESH